MPAGVAGLGQAHGEGRDGVHPVHHRRRPRPGDDGGGRRARRALPRPLCPRPRPPGFVGAGAAPSAVLEMLKRVTPELSCPVVLFSYFNPIVRRGLANFTAAAKEAGAQGLLVPALPYVAACTLRSEAMKNKLELVLLTTPATPEERMKEITNAAERFVYLVSVNGVTGSRENVNLRVQSLIQEIKQVTDKPVAVGFGISKPEHVKQIAEWGADGVIIGSAMVKQLGEAASPKEGLKRLEKYARSMKNAIP